MTMKNVFTALVTSGLVLSYSIIAWAGSSSGGGPAGDAGSSGAEPALYAFILLSLIPGIYFVRKARAAQPIPIETNR